MLDFLEALSYFFSFWQFLGSASFRARTLSHWRSLNRGWAVLVVPIEVSSSIFCGAIIPGYIIYLIVAE